MDAMRKARQTDVLENLGNPFRLLVQKAEADS